MQEVTITLRPGKEHLELCEFLTISGLAQTGGQAKQIIQSGEIKLNDKIEPRKRKKLVNKDIIEYKENKYNVIIN